ncbi:substrate-binding periplasmic protein [Aliiglaciecola lipolytica]|uniref:ABC-type amino acid transport/signal transduction system, periplasmic component/domain n=1 Tax=Aliiglaciecola lipolytica E3 TaxID=1127673 RepID=K6XWF5_9ALTE|nr:transporter substrate-binding domain-containing protein [Aliiglaciecola lipolytica]GAC15986.1 ABC-type amino acid transport/signal transduction system, periplasmic component/domain [Aliiglaciecola lipolytica E3]
MQKYFTKIWLIGSLIFCGTLYANQNANQTKGPTKLIFAINDPGSPPYLYFDKVNKGYRGIIADFFNSFTEDNTLDVRYLDSSRARNEYLVLNGKADFFLSSPAWLDNPDNILLSDELLLHRSFFYSISPFSQPFSLTTLPKNLICTRRGYIYPSLSQLFKDKKLIRVDSSSQITITNMLIKGRCDYAVMNEYNANSVLNLKQFCGINFYQSPNSIHDAPLTFVINKQSRDIIPTLNDQWRIFQNSGQLEDSIRVHGGTSDLDSQKNCS